MQPYAIVDITDLKYADLMMVFVERTEIGSSSPTNAALHRN